MRFTIAVLGIILLASPIWISAADQQLFVIERTTNGNVVHYDERLNTDGDRDAGEPVVVYWTMGSATGKRQPLSFLERTRAYGFQIRTKSPGRYMPVSYTHLRAHE